MNVARVQALLLIAACSTRAANILGLLVIPSPSHHIWNRSLMLALAARGHNVTVLSADEDKSPAANYTQYVVHEAYDYEMDVLEIAHDTPFGSVDSMFEWSETVCRKTMSSRGARDLLSRAADTSFDVVIADATCADCQLGFVHAFGNPPLIGVTAYSHPTWLSYMTGNPHNPAYIPELTTTFGDSMSFPQRLYNTLLHLYTLYRIHCSYLPRVDAMTRRFFGEGFPAVGDVRNNASLAMVNTQVGFDQPRPLVPAVVDVGGLHIGPSKPLPQHLKKLMDEAANGFIYFSLGSNIRSDALPAERRQVFLDAFSRLPYRVFWKWESDSLPGQPDNVVVAKWMPQRDILAHPNILLFVSHNGLLSTQEAIFCGVPIVSVPFFADQKINANKARAKGFAERVEYKTVTADQLLTTIQKVINDPRYKENAQRLSRLMKDRPDSPLERAVFWTEYVIRHRGAPHLRSAAADLPWHQYLLLDVACFLVAGVLAALLALYWSCRAVVAWVSPGSRPGNKLKNQ
ncbi:UDP-glycosyltransferase UGT5-like [Bacillus rossius redtenbacheri]|uniref:UDP-glycosyltransferase UGT5-like n=1 Tax=Bacillus rossius redtenbacheri TaxID=93214 RepID=UPI002FDDC8A1